MSSIETDSVVPYEGGPELVRFGTPLDVEKQARLALQAIERGDRPEAADMAALLVELVIQKGPEMVQRLAAAGEWSG